MPRPTPPTSPFPHGAAGMEHRVTQRLAARCMVRDYIELRGGDAARHINRGERGADVIKLYAQVADMGGRVEGKGLG